MTPIRKSVSEVTNHCACQWTTGGNTEEWKPVGGRHVTSLGGGAGNCCSVIHLLHEHGQQARLAQVRPCQGGEGKNIENI